jgi:hypothetical protein
VDLREAGGAVDVVLVLDASLVGGGEAEGLLERLDLGWTVVLVA